MTTKNPTPPASLPLSMCLFGSHLASEETTASTLSYEVKAAPAISASEIEAEQDLSEKTAINSLNEVTAWVALVRETTADSRAMTQDERRAVDDYFLSHFRDDVGGSGQD